MFQHNTKLQTQQKVSLITKMIKFNTIHQILLFNKFNIGGIQMTTQSDRMQRSYSNHTKSYNEHMH